MIEDSNLGVSPVNNLDDQTIESHELFRQKYEERKASITQTDEELIELSKQKGDAFPDSTVNEFIKTLLMFFNEESKKRKSPESKKFDAVLRKTQNRPAIDIGCGSDAMDKEDWIQQFLLMNKFDAVDPFVTPEKYYNNCSKEYKKENLDYYEKEIFPYGKFYQTDGLSYLKTQPDESSNAMTFSINFSLIRSGEYLRRLAQEIFRVVPMDGVYISDDSSDLEEEASKLFPYRLEIMGVKFFAKTPFENNEQ